MPSYLHKNLYNTSILFFSESDSFWIFLKTSFTTQTEQKFISMLILLRNENFCFSKKFVMILKLKIYLVLSFLWFSRPQVKDKSTCHVGCNDNQAAGRAASERKKSRLGSQWEHLGQWHLLVSANRSSGPPTQALCPTPPQFPVKTSHFSSSYVFSSCQSDG